MILDFDHNNKEQKNVYPSTSFRGCPVSPQFYVARFCENLLISERNEIESYACCQNL